MGITGLLPFLEKGKASRPANIKSYTGCTVAADAYCWLHKGAFSCADKLARGDETDMYVQYCMKYVNMLLSHDIKPILVFDGRHLPAKAQTEKKRRQKREENRKQAASLLRQGHTTEALSFLRRCIDVTHKMALSLMRECRKRNVDCIVAPYEADAQLAFFSLEGIADLIITEDSDLLLFGCKRVMFKLDLAGNGFVVEQDQLYLAMGIRPENYNFEKFRYMCILSGCDYLDSLPGIGLGKACKFITRTQDPDIHKALSRLPSQLNLRALSVSSEYRDEFMRANAMFKHQLVFDPRTRKTRPLTPFEDVHPTSPLACGPLPGCEAEFDNETSYQLALGNLDPFNLEKVDDYDPDNPRSEISGAKTSGWNQVVKAAHPSIWLTNFKEEISKRKPRTVPSFMPSESRPSTKGIVKTIDSSKVILNSSRKRALEDEEQLDNAKKIALETSNLTALYTTSPPKQLVSSPSSPIGFSNVNSPLSPILSAKRPSRNPFARSPQSGTTTNAQEEDKSVSTSAACATPTSEPSRKYSALSKFARAVQRTTTDGKPIVQSRYFSSSFGDTRIVDSEQPQTKRQESPQNLLRDVSNTMKDIDDEQEQIMLQSYTQSPPPSGDLIITDKRIPMVRKKPLFASLSNSPGNNRKGSENNEDLASTSIQGCGSLISTMQMKFAHQANGPSPVKSPSKNPFKKKSFDEKYLECNLSVNSDADVKVDGPEQQCGEESKPFETEEDVDDPEFESCSSQMTLSQVSSSSLGSEEGFGNSIGASSLTPPSAKLTMTTRHTPAANFKRCRMQGLKKSVVSSQSKLSTFGFMAKPKLQTFKTRSQ